MADDWLTALPPRPQRPSDPSPSSLGSPKTPKACERSTNESPCFVDPTRPPQTKYCDFHGRPSQCAKDWRHANPFPYDRAQAKLARNQHPGGWAEYLRKYRSEHLEQTRAQNRKAAAAARARKKALTTGQRSALSAQVNTPSPIQQLASRAPTGAIQLKNQHFDPKWIRQ